MSKYLVISHTAYPLTSEDKPEVYNCAPITVYAPSCEDAAKFAVERQRHNWEEYGSPGAVGTFRFAVIGESSWGPTVEIVDVTVEPATVRVTEVISPTWRSPNG